MGKAIVSVRKVLDKVLPTVAAIFLLIGVSSTIFGTIIRTFGIPIRTTWVEETTRYCIIYGTLLLVGIGLRKGSLTQLTIIQERLHGKAKAGYELFLNLISLALFALLLVAGFKFALTGIGMESPGLHIDFVWVYFSVPIFCFFAVLELCMMCIECLRELFGKAQDTTKEGGDSAL